MRAAVLLAALAGTAAFAAAQPAEFPFDWTFDVALSTEVTRAAAVFEAVAPTDGSAVWIQLDESDLVGPSWRVDTVIKPPRCEDPADWATQGFNVGHAPFRSFVVWEGCDGGRGTWTIEFDGEASALSTGSARFHVKVCPGGIGFESTTVGTARIDRPVCRDA